MLCVISSNLLFCKAHQESYSAGHSSDKEVDDPPGKLLPLVLILLIHVDTGFDCIVGVRTLDLINFVFAGVDLQ